MSLVTPKSQDDTKIQFRFDQDHIYDDSAKDYDIILQANREAESDAARRLAKENPHAILAKIRAKGNVSKEYFTEGLLKDFEIREKERDFS
jgi:hypothetical protein